MRKEPRCTRGDLIRESRLALGYSLGQLATKVGQTAATVRTWEQGTAVPDEESRQRLAKVLDLEAGQPNRVTIRQGDERVPENGAFLRRAQHEPIEADDHHPTDLTVSDVLPLLVPPAVALGWASVLSLWVGLLTFDLPPNTRDAVFDFFGTAGSRQGPTFGRSPLPGEPINRVIRRIQ